ncbi:MAG: hypothetical protein LBU73_09075 [Helicobacteraceae bacterium]|jgi:lipopolysaccharide/colanic/teichoic acid biosynthesis glycosyltransferase|nr:hypothetical protein [Helicobacteraceae bacterium]
MLLAGERGERRLLTENYEKEIARYTKPHSIKPRISGWAWISIADRLWKIAAKANARLLPRQTLEDLPRNSRDFNDDLNGFA